MLQVQDYALLVNALNQPGDIRDSLFDTGRQLVTLNERMHAVANGCDRGGRGRPYR